MRNYSNNNKKVNSDEPTALALVVRREAPSSGKPGDKAIISKDGKVDGWIGGGCTKGIVIKEALSAIREQTPRLVRILPQDGGVDTPGVKNYLMTCQSGGSVEVYIEPIMPATQIRIFGRSHIAKALCEVGRAAGFEISVISDLAEVEMFPEAQNVTSLKSFDKDTQYPNDFVVVCTQGEQDEESLHAALNTKPRYISFVSSRKKANSILMALKKRDVPHDELVKVNTPAGIDINAKTPHEVAISILAQIIQEKRSDSDESSSSGLAQDLKEAEDLYINPVCKIPVQKSTAKHIIEHNGEKVYFCCDGCKTSFEKEPDLYLKS